MFKNISKKQDSKNPFNVNILLIQTLHINDDNKPSGSLFSFQNNNPIGSASQVMNHSNLPNSIFSTIPNVSSGQNIFYKPNSNNRINSEEEVPSFGAVSFSNINTNIIGKQANQNLNGSQLINPLPNQNNNQINIFSKKNPPNQNQVNQNSNTKSGFLGSKSIFNPK